MPESRKRRPRRRRGNPATGPEHEPVTSVGAARASAPAGPNPRWYVPVMLGLMLLGLVWIVVWYVFENMYPIPGIGSWNLVIGFAIILVGFLMTTRWR
ncbi:cell division protein CrgA [Pseudokineococcus basanitobsidens]|uniref:Cell division protein CrgA n=1 Tax=Pseudokineococcus basanitobsidens TaxID=1926649 RepID=A0ABU8RP55_9ACTN